VCGHGKAPSHRFAQNRHKGASLYLLLRHIWGCMSRGELGE